MAGNWIGRDKTGKFTIANANDGVSILNGMHMTAIGGLNQVNPDGSITRTAGNVISGNRVMGILISGGSLDVVAGNLIGTDKTGKFPIPNAFAGVYIDGGQSDTIGGTAVGARKRHLRRISPMALS